VLDFPKFGCINVHGSLLPRWRGAAPIQAAILAGDTETGITIIKMDAGVDTGPLLSQRSIPILPKDTAGSLFGKLSQLGAELLLETLPLYFSGEIQSQPQDDSHSTYAPLLKKEDGLLDFSQPAVALERSVRAFNPWPGAFMMWQDVPLKILKAHVLSGKARIGERIIVQGLPAVAAQEGLLVLEEVHPAGKKPMPGKAFLAGARGWYPN
jgi:methionyl-tRNA formyltransferase